MHPQKTPIKLSVMMSSPTRGNSKHLCVRGGTGQVCMTFADIDGGKDTEFVVIKVNVTTDGMNVFGFEPVLPDAM